MTKTLPIPFNADMMHAILDGRKTQTRRIIRHQPMSPADIGYSGIGFPFVRRPFKGPYPSPYAPGDLLWVRETWRTLQKWDCIAPRNLMDDIDKIDYAASGYTRNPLWAWGKNRPSMFMPRWASRLTLRVTNARTQRLQDISEADAIAEGAPQYASSTKIQRPFNPDWKGSYMRGFQAVWDACYGRDHWDVNPWVWVYDFDVIRKNVDEVAA